jgi:hypothetical protein
MPTYDLKEELFNSEIIRNKIHNECYAQNLYASLCNVGWRKQEMLSMLEGFEWSISWRGAGALVADLRNAILDTKENYMDWYCSGIISIESSENIVGYVSEGEVTLEIQKDLADLDWVVNKRY